MAISLFLIIMTFLASVVGTLSGFGVGTVLVSALSTSYPLPQVLLFTAIIHLAHDTWKLILFRKGINWRILLYFGLSSVVASFLGSIIVVLYGSSPIFLQFLGLFLILSALTLLLRPTLSIKQTAGALMGGGALSGLSFGLFGMGGVIRSLSLIFFDINRATYLATGGAVVLLVDVTRALVYRLSGIVLGPVLFTSLLFCIPLSFLGAKLGEYLVNRVPQKQFRPMVAGFILLMGIKLLLKI
jgi:hypothetical protein